MNPEYPEFYVYENGYELVSRTANYLVVRNGEMRIRDTRNESIYRYTDQLIKARITENNLYELIDNETLEVIHNPWFEVWNSENNPNDYESDPIDELSKAESLAYQLEDKANV